MLLRKIKSRLYMKNVSLTKRADDLRAFEGTAVSAQEATLFKMKPSGLPWWRSGSESACQCRGHGFKPWSGKIPHDAEQLGPDRKSTRLNSSHT